MIFFRKRPPLPQTKQPLLKRRWRWSLRSAFWLHSLLVSAIVLECLMVVALPLPEQPAEEQIVLEAPPLSEPPLAEPAEIHAFVPQRDDWHQAEAGDISHLAAVQTDSRWSLLTDADIDDRSPADRTAASSFLNDQLRDAIAAADEKSEEDKLDRLRQLTGQLNDGSTDQSVAQVTSQISKLLGATARATEPAKEPVAGEFDIDSAQLHDVRRELLPDGSFKYIAVLIDAAGRTQETEMTAAEGESAFKTFELIKQNPLLERVYRGVVMSLIDKMLKPASP